MKMMKKEIAYIIVMILFPVFCFGQGNKGKVDDCAPVKDGKVCYTDDIVMQGASQEALYEAISSWAKTEYGRDVFVSNVSCNRGRKTILISSKIELLLNETDKTYLKYKMYISCYDNNYKVEVTNLTYQYDPDKADRLRVYPAESVILNGGKGNIIPSIKNPELFCNATFFFVEGLLDDVYLAAKKY